MTGEVLVIELNRGGGDTCCLCGGPSDGKHGVPVSIATAMVISNESFEEWGGMPACPSCWQKHEAGEFVGTYPSYTSQ